jgi:hypothetical protein
MGILGVGDLKYFYSKRIEFLITVSFTDLKDYL